MMILTLLATCHASDEEKVIDAHETPDASGRDASAEDELGALEFVGKVETNRVIFTSVFALCFQ